MLIVRRSCAVGHLRRHRWLDPLPAWHSGTHLHRGSGHIVVTICRWASAGDFRHDGSMTSPDDTPALSVRLAGPSDAAVVARLLHSSNVDLAPPPPTASVADFAARFEVMLWRDDVRVWLAETDDEPVGCAFVTWSPSPHHAGGVAQVEELYAIPARRDDGIGAVLMEALGAWVTRHGVGEVRSNADVIEVPGPFGGPTQPPQVHRGRIEP